MVHVGYRVGAILYKLYMYSRPFHVAWATFYDFWLRGPSLLGLRGEYAPPPGEGHEQGQRTSEFKLKARAIVER